MGVFIIVYKQKIMGIFIVSMFSRVLRAVVILLFKKERFLALPLLNYLEVALSLRRGCCVCFVGRGFYVSSTGAGCCALRRGEEVSPAVRRVYCGALTKVSGLIYLG